mgnify:CR=1 FL=1
MLYRFPHYLILSFLSPSCSRICTPHTTPPGLLAEIAVLSTVPAEAIDTLCGLVVAQLCGAELNYGELDSIINSGALNEGDAKGALAALNYILSNASKYGVKESELHIETQQLGLTKAVADTIGARYTAHVEDLTAVKNSNTLRLQQPGDLQWRVDCVLGSSTGKVGAGNDGGGISVQLKIGSTPAFEVDHEMFKLLHSELAAAKEQMNVLG